MTHLLLNRPQQDLGEYAGVYVPVSHNAAVVAMAQDMLMNDGAVLSYLRDHAVKDTLYTDKDIAHAQRTASLILNYGQSAQVTLDDISRVWWLTKVYETYSAAHRRNMPNPYAIYTRLLRDVKPFMLALKQDIIRALLLNHTRMVSSAEQVPVTQK